MYEIDQTDIPGSFIELFLLPGATRPSAPRATIAARYELCEDMAQMLTEHAQGMRLGRDMPEIDVLEQLLGGLTVEGSVVGQGEALWVVRRLAELLDWPAAGLAPNERPSLS
jgi:hypothetical protein